MTYTCRGIRQRKDTDKWEVRLLHKDPLTGESITTYHTVEAKTEKQANRKCNELILELETKGSVSASKMTVKDLIDLLLDHKESSGGIEPSTLYTYRNDSAVINRYIGLMQVSDLGIPQVEKWLKDMQEDGLAPRTIAKPYRLLSQAFKHAIALDIVKKNPCVHCKPPKIERKKVNALSRSERTRMLNIATNFLGTPLHTAIAIALLTGMRNEEICALKFSDLNNDGTITVHHALGRAENGYYLKSPKNESSRRTIPLDPAMHDYLTKLRDDLQAEARYLGADFGDPFILGTHESDSRPYHPYMLSREFRTFAKTHGFSCSFHDLRHTFATMMISSGTDVRTVASLLGHSNVSQTLNTYAEVDPDAKRLAGNKIRDAFDVEGINLFSFKKPQEIEVEDPGSITVQLTELRESIEEIKAMLNFSG